MATAEELLNSLSMSNSENEGHIVIGLDRKITVPASLKRIAVQYDHNVETVTFDCPRYWDGIDMSKMAIYVNYMRSDNYTDSYPVDNITVDEADPNIMHFDWTISLNVTEVHGPIVFLVCIKATDKDEDGNEINHWNSELCKDMYVSEGMENEEQEELNYSDLVSQLLIRMSTVEQINIQASEMRTLLTNTETAATIAEEAASNASEALDLINTKDTSIRNDYANAIKGEADGEIIRVDDVSPVEHDIKCRVHGKNLVNPVDFTIGKSISGGGAGETITIPNNTIMAVIKHIDVEPNTTYTFSLDNSIYWLDRICEMDKNDLCTFNHGFYSSEINNHSMYSWTTQADTKYIVVRVRNTVGETPTLEDIQTASIQIEKGTVATEYEPYIDPTTVTVIGCGKNLIPYPYADTTKTMNGITFTDNCDGSITINGTATAPAYFFLQNDAEYGETIDAIFADSGNNNGIYTASKRLFYNSNTKKLTVNINTGTILSNEKIYPQLEVGLVATDYEPYTGETVTPDSDGICTVTSKSPIMTIFADTPGVTIEAEYNRDTTKAMTSYIWTEEIKDEIVAKVEDDVADVLASLNSYAESLIGGDS